MDTAHRRMKIISSISLYFDYPVYTKPGEGGGASQKNTSFIPIPLHRRSLKHFAG